MATYKGEYQLWNGTSWDNWYFQTSADMVVETANYKVLTNTERNLINTYLGGEFNEAYKLVKLGENGELDLSGKYIHCDDLCANDISTNDIYSGDGGDNIDIYAPDGIRLHTYSIAFINEDGGGLIRNVAEPQEPSDAATKNYVDTLTILGAKIEGAVRCATVSNITLSGLLNIDGVSLEEGDRVLVKNQNTSSQNGVYVASTGTWTKVANDSDKRSLITVIEGTTQKRYQYYNTDGTTWVIYFIDDSYTAVLNGGLELDSTGFGFKIKSGGVTNDMLAGSIVNTKIASFASSDTDAWTSIASASTSAGISAKFIDIYSAIKQLRGTANFNTNNTQTIAGAYEIAEGKNKVTIYEKGAALSTTGNKIGDIALRKLV